MSVINSYLNQLRGKTLIASALVLLLTGTGLLAWISRVRPIPTRPLGKGYEQETALRQSDIVTSTVAADSSQQASAFTVTNAVLEPGAGPQIQLCQALGPAAPHPIDGVDSISGVCQPGCGEATWDARAPIPWQAFAQGEYVGPHRTAHTPQYRLRVDDQLEFIYRLTREESSTPYELNVGDEIQIESLTDEKLDRNLVIQPDGSITMRLLGQVQAARRTVEQLRSDLEEKYKKWYKVPSITVTPVRVNTRLEDLRATVDSRAGQGGQSRNATVTPAGNVQLPALGSVPAVGLTLDELKLEIDERYAQIVDGIEVTPVLLTRAPRLLFVLGEVGQPGQFEMQGPTTLMMALARAGSWPIGANLRQVVVFRRGEDWRLLATKLDIRGALYGRRPAPSDEIWLRDSDVVVVPKLPIQEIDEWIDLVFTRGVYGVIPFQGISLNFAKAATL